MKTLKKKLITLGIFVDYSKAFDSINHNILIQKLSCYGIRGTALSLIKSYLSRRFQSVCIGKYHSSLLPIKCGVPQGSLLGPLLFNIYINDITNLSSRTLFVLYADDTNMLISGTDLNEIIAKTNLLLQDLSLWSQANRLKLNPTKTKAVVFRPKNKNISTTDNIYLNGKRIEIVDVVKILGVFFTNTLSWEAHINHVRSKICSLLGMIHRCKQFLPRTVLKTIYYSHIYPFLNYCLLVWGTTSKHSLSTLLVLQKKYIRILENVSYTFTTQGLFEKHLILKVHNMYNYRLIQTYRRAVKEHTSEFLDMANLLAVSHAYNHRSHLQFRSPQCRTSYGFQKLQYNLGKLLNNSPSNILSGSKLNTLLYFVGQ